MIIITQKSFRRSQETPKTSLMSMLIETNLEFLSMTKTSLFSSVN